MKNLGCGSGIFRVVWAETERDSVGEKMANAFTDTKRSEVMSRIHGRGNKAKELALIKSLRAHCIAGWRRHRPHLVNPT